MKNLLIAALVIFNLTHAYAEESDLPIPGDDGSGTVQPLPDYPTPGDEWPQEPTPTPELPPAQPPAQPPTQQPPQPPVGMPGADTDDKISVGDRALAVTDSVFVTGTIASISRDGKLVTIRGDYDGRFTTVKTKSVGVWLNCNKQGHCYGAKGMYEYNRGRNYNPVQIESVYSNDYLLVKEDFGGRKYIAKTKEVLRSVGCDRKTGICQGQTVLTEPVGSAPYFETQVLEVYQDGVYLISTYNGGKDIRKNGDLVKQINCYKGLCVGQQVNMGNIQRVYDNGFFTILDPYSGNLTLRPYREIR
ncbi:hypothetical protein [Bdellovibrio sp. HCB209]|uniref:hypothetical protein n=1 Tax=Bdellovibrio sp. HCB209 TaxID=3394354 RepID=UPI0039B39C06